MKAGVFKLVKIWRGAAVAASACVIATFPGFAAAHGESAPSGLLKVRFGGDLASTRVVLELSQSSQGKLLSGDGDPDVMVELPKIKASGDTDGQGQGLVKAWSIDARPGGSRRRG